MQTPLYDNLPVRYSGFSKSSSSDPTQIKIQENFFHRYLPVHNQFSWSTLSQNTDVIRNAEFRSFSSFYLDCLFEFDLGKTVRKCVDFVDYLVV